MTHRDSHDDEESCRRAVTDFATNAKEAWNKFMIIVANDREAKKIWIARGYVARRVRICISIEGRYDNVNG